MDPPNASSDLPSQLEVTQVTEQLSTMPETQQLGSKSTPENEWKIHDQAFLTAPEVGRDQVRLSTTPKQLSYLSGTTVENTPGVYRDLFLGVSFAGTPEGPALNVFRGKEERGLVLSGIPSSSPPFSTLPGFHSHRDQRADMEKALGFGDEDDEVEREGNQDSRGEELPLSLQSGLRGGFSAERSSIEIPDSEGIEGEKEEEYLDRPGPETPRMNGESGEEETVADTPFVELVAASTDGVVDYLDEERGDLVEGALLTTRTQEGASKILDDSQEHSIQTAHTKETESQILEDSQEPAIQNTDTKDIESELLEDSQELAIQNTYTKETESEILGESQNPAFQPIFDLSEQAPETAKKILEVTDVVDSSKDGLSEIVCQTLVISPDEHPENDSINHTSEEEINSTGIGISATKLELEHTPIIENEISKELHSDATEATTIENSEGEDFEFIDPSVTMELPIVMSLNGGDVHPKVSSDNKEDGTPITNADHAGIKTSSSEKLDPNVIDPLEHDVISQNLEAGSINPTPGTAEMESSSREIDLPATMLPPQRSFSSTDLEATPNEDEPGTASGEEMQSSEIIPPVATLLSSKENVALQNHGAKSGEKTFEISTVEQELSEIGIPSPVAPLLPQEVAVIEELRMGTGTGVDLGETTAEAEMPDNKIGDPQGVLPKPNEEVDIPEDELTLPATIVGQDDISYKPRRMEIPDSDISLDDAESITDEQNLAVKGTGDGVSRQVEMDDANNAMDNSADVTTSIKELEKDGCTDQVNDSNEVTGQSVGSIAINPIVEAKLQLSETTNKSPEPNLEKNNEVVEKIKSTGEKAPVPVLATEATINTLSTESLEESSAQPSSLLSPEKAAHLDSKNAEEELGTPKSEKPILPPLSLQAEEPKIPPAGDRIFEPGTTKLQVQGSESVKARPNQEPKESITTCKVIIIPASSDSRLTDPPPSSSSSSSIQQPSTVVDIPPIAPPSPKAKRKASKKRASLAVEELSSPSKTNIPSSPPLKKPRVEDASPTKATEEEEKSPVKNKDDILVDELRAMKVVCFPSPLIYLHLLMLKQASIQSRNSNLELEISRIKEKLEAVRKELKYVPLPFPLSFALSFSYIRHELDKETKSNIVP